MEKVVALLILVGSGCRLSDPKGIWINGVWLASIFTATFAVLAAKENCEILRRITIISAAITMICIMFGFISLIREIQNWSED